MARTTGPLMSMDASGSLHKTLVYAKWKGRNYVRSWVIPANPRSASQYATRALMRFLTTQWSVISTPDQATWAAQADSEKISPFNRYVQSNMKDWTQFLFPGQAYPVLRPSAPSPPVSQSASGGVGLVTGQVVNTVNTSSWGVAIFLAEASIVPSRPQTRLILPMGSAATVDFVLPAVPPGVYNVNSLCFNIDGSPTTLTGADVSVTVT